MTVTNYDQWIAAGSPWYPAQCVNDFANTMRRHGYTVYILGDNRHLTSSFPQDHTPYSHTPWPGAQPYPAVLALDIMPGGDMDWHDLGQRIVDDKIHNVAGTSWIKYINWTDNSGSCWHYSWEPNLTTEPSSDTGHIHISARTDYVGTHTSYDPITSTPGPTPQPGKDAIMTALPQIQKGSQGDSVRVAQSILNLRGAHLAVDGDFGPLTDGAVRTFQSAYHLTVDGVVGPHTWSTLLLLRDVT